MLPKIFCFSNVSKDGNGPAVALAEDGMVLGGHWCSNEGYVCGDLGVTEGTRKDCHEKYREHYPEGYTMEFVRVADMKEHKALQKAIHRNKTYSAQPPAEVAD